MVLPRLSSAWLQPRPAVTRARPQAAAKTALRRARAPMLPDIARLLKKRGLVAAYRARPAYQQNDYLGWIGRAVRLETRQKRIDQMLDELQSGNSYMKMAWVPRGTAKAGRRKAPSR